VSIPDRLRIFGRPEAGVYCPHTQNTDQEEAVKINPVTLLFALLLLGGCATTSMDLNHKFDDASFRYERALRWGNLQQATQFQKQPQRFTDRELQRLGNIRITAYDLVDSTRSGNQIRQTVEIQYYTDDDVVVRTLLDHQRWEYDEDAGQWYLMTPVPAFGYY